jgi:hypothetical protein
MTAKDLFEILNSSLGTIGTIVAFKPLWVFIIIFSATQLAKTVANAYNVPVLRRKLDIRLFATAIGIVSAILLFENDLIVNIFAGVALSSFTIILYNVTLSFTNKETSPQWLKDFGKWLSGK